MEMAETALPLPLHSKSLKRFERCRVEFRRRANEPPDLTANASGRIGSWS